jgi:hypothetical protein
MSHGRRRAASRALDAPERRDDNRVHLRLVRRRDEAELLLCRLRFCARGGGFRARLLDPCARRRLGFVRGLARAPLLDFAEALAQLLAPRGAVAVASGELYQG